MSPKTPQEWLRLATIPLLGLVLIAVLCWPSAESTPLEEPPSLIAEPSATQGSKLVPVAKSKWPSISLEEIAAFSPFDPPLPPPPPPPVLAASETAVSDEGIHASQMQGDKERLTTSVARGPRPVVGTLQAVFFDARGAAAIFNSKVIRVGDVLPDGNRVVEITSNGVRLDGSGIEDSTSEGDVTN